MAVKSANVMARVEPQVKERAEQVMAQLGLPVSVVIYVCSICGYVYEPAVGDPEHGIPAGTAFEELPEDWHCPRCRQGKERFNRA